ncbi:MAG: hypothetical protein ACYDEQ_12855, partial [Desulfocucumaceae bacterium]
MKSSFFTLFTLLIIPLQLYSQTAEYSAYNKGSIDTYWVSGGLGISGNEAIGLNASVYATLKGHCFSAQFIDMKENQWDINFKPVNSRFEINATYGRHAITDHTVAIAMFGLCYVKSNIHEVVGYDPYALFNNEIYEEVEKTALGITGKLQFLVKAKYFGIGPSLVVNYTKNKSNVSLFLDIAMG